MSRSRPRTPNGTRGNFAEPGRDFKRGWYTDRVTAATAKRVTIRDKRKAAVGK